MNLNSPILFIEINKLEFIFGVGELDEISGFKLLYNHTTPIEGIVDNKIIELFSYNFGMLFVGYLQEISLINITISTIVGFTFFILLFYKMYEYYASKSSANMPIFIIMTTIWSIYGIAALFDFKVKNAFYNILDVFSKNFYGLFLAYLVYSLRI